MNENTCSGAASVDQFTGGLFGSLLKKLLGPNGRLWLRRLKKFDRREDPFVRAQEVGLVSAMDPVQNLDGLIRKLQDQGVSVSLEIWHPMMPNIREVAARRPYEQSPSGKRFFSVRLGDLMSMEEVSRCTYADVLAALADEGFAPCDYWSGLCALGIVIGYYRSLDPDFQASPPLISFLLVSDPFCVGESERYHSGRLIQASVWLNRERGGQGGSWAHLTPHAIDAPLFEPGDGRKIQLSAHHPLRDLDSRLLCQAVDD